MTAFEIRFLPAGTQGCLDSDEATRARCYNVGSLRATMYVIIIILNLIRLRYNTLISR